MDKTHPEYYCDNCNNPNVTWCAPNELWNKLCKREEIICPKCFQDRADEAGINLIFKTNIMKKELTSDEKDTLIILVFAMIVFVWFIITVIQIL